MEPFAAYKPQYLFSSGGKPAPAASTMPSFEHVDGKLQVWDLLVAQLSRDGEMMLFSRWYGSVCVLAPDGPCPVHHEPGQLWEWRPVLQRLAWDGIWQTLGSQRELTWRKGLSDMMHFVHVGREAGDEMPDLEPPVDRSEHLLRRLLSPQQRIDLAGTGDFRVRGAGGSLYRIDVGNGFELLDPITNASVASFCLHPEGWIPDFDVAIATKLALEDEELEADCLENARRYPRTSKQRRRATDFVAARLERELL